jgi:nitroreductase
MLENLLAAANHSATGSNKQQVNWLVVEDKDVGILAEITAKYMRSLEVKGPKYKNRILSAWDSGVDTVCRNAPAVVIVHGPGRNRDCLLAMTQLSLLALTLGMGTCWAGFIMGAAENSAAMRVFLDLPEGHACHGAMMIGYPKFDYPRLPLRNEPTIRWR